MYDVNKDATRKQTHLQNLQTSEVFLILDFRRVLNVVNFL